MDQSVIRLENVEFSYPKGPAILKVKDLEVKKGEKILTLKDGGSLIADFAGKVGKREIAQGVLGSESLIITSIS